MGIGLGIGMLLSGVDSPVGTSHTAMRLSCHVQMRDAEQWRVQRLHTLASSVLPTPVGPRNMKLAIGRPGSLRPIRDLQQQMQGIQTQVPSQQTFPACCDTWPRCESPVELLGCLHATCAHSGGGVLGV